MWHWRIGIRPDIITSSLLILDSRLSQPSFVKTFAIHLGESVIDRLHLNITFDKLFLSLSLLSEKWVTTTCQQPSETLTHKHILESSCKRPYYLWRETHLTYLSSSSKHIILSSKAFLLVSSTWKTSGILPLHLFLGFMIPWTTRPVVNSRTNCSIKIMGKIARQLHHVMTTFLHLQCFLY